MVSSSLLLVDDDERIIELMTDILKDEGYIVDDAFNGQEALEKFKPDKYSVVIIDYFMPYILGDAVARRIRELDPQVGIILLTGLRRSLGPENLVYFDRVIEKPANPKRLLEALREIISERAMATI